MGEILTTYNELSTMMQIFWGCAIVSSLIFAVQFLLTLFGLDHSDIDADIDFNTDTDHDLGAGGSLNLFSIKNLIGFLVGFGWAGVCFSSSISSPFWLTVVATLVGAIFVATFIFIYKQTRKLDQDGTFKIEECLGKTATVYLRIPGAENGKGKIQISINGSVLELDALTDDDDIPSGQNVKVTEIINNSTVKVTNSQYSLIV